MRDYMEAMKGGEDRQTALNGLISQLFFTTQLEWIQAHPDADLDEALQRFADALMQYRKENTALRPILENAGFAAPRDMTALSYAADQLVGMERDTGEEVEVKHQIKQGITKNRKIVSFVKADRQVIQGQDENKWGNQITQYINDQIRKGKDVTVYSENGVPLTITKYTAGKAAYWNTDKQGNKVSKDEYALKLRIESHIDEAAQVSKGKGNRANDKKSHQFAMDGFNYRVAYFQDFDG